MRAILADIGGTKMRVASNAHTSISSTHVETPQQYEQGLELIVQMAKQLAEGGAIDRFVAGVPGVLSHDKRSLATAEHLMEWIGKPLADDLAQALECTVTLENDTALVGLGENKYGAGVGSAIMAYLTISTGVNGVRIIDGHIDRSTEGFEIGGQYLSHGDSLETFEELVSGSAIHKKYGMHPRDLGKDSPVWEDLARITAIGVHNMILEWSPDTIVLGGSMFNEIGISVESVTEHLKLLMHKFPTIPRLIHSQLKDDGGLYGGLALLEQ
ncbi:MAG: putative glucokinase [Candidatus Kaiserbacteria bacterium]|nr:putative glucokinase [Candidatus Kaiserbacteria bacterium]